eukprot:6178732-Pleurochrysis_carterae.AAC.1
MPRSVSGSSCVESAATSHALSISESASTSAVVGDSGDGVDGTHAPSEDAQHCAPPPPPPPLPSPPSEAAHAPAVAPTTAQRA